MPNDLSASPTPVASGDGTAPAAEHAPSSPPPPGPETPATAPTDRPAEPAADGTPPRLFSDLPTAEQRYKSLQAAYTRTTQTLAQLGDLQTLREERQLLQQLRQDPEFQTWAQARLTQARTGHSDPETQQALALVSQIADEIAEQKLAPLKQQALQQKTTQVFSQMDQRHGPEWRQLKPQMLQALQQGIAHGWYAPQVEESFDLDFLDGLYARVVAADPAYAAKRYQAKLAAKQAQTSTATPGTAPAATASAPASSIEEAFAAAKRLHGVT